jgi:hypothetical protein
MTQGDSNSAARVREGDILPRLSCFHLAASFATAVAFASMPALADVTKDQCIDANGKAQELRRDGKLSAARDQLQACGNSACPAMIRDDCTKRLNELEGAQPTVIFDARDASGRDLIAVTVTMDGRPLVGKLDGKALPVDPGEHEFTFTVAGQAPIVEKLVVRESEKERHERVVIGPPAAPAPPLPVAEAPAQTPPAPTPGGLGTWKVVGLALGGAGVAGVAIGSAFGVTTFSETSKQKSDCASPAICSNHAQAVSDHSSASTDGTISMVAFAAGGALIAAGAVLFFLPPRSSEQLPATALSLLPSVGPGGGFLSLSGGF